MWLAGIVAAALAGFDAGWLPQSFYSAYNLEFFFGMAVACALRSGTIPAPRLILVSGVMLFAVAALAENFHLLNGYADISRIAYGLARPP